MPFLLCRREGPSPDALSFCNKTKFSRSGLTPTLKYTKVSYAFKPPCFSTVKFNANKELTVT